MNTLPIELQNEIWNIYWKGEFKDRVLDKLNDINDKILKMNFFLDKHFYANKCTGYDYMISHYLRQYNDLLNTIRKENGLYIYISQQQTQNYRYVLTILIYDHVFQK